MDIEVPWRSVLSELLDRVKNSAGAMHHIALGNKFENWLQVEFVGVLIEQGISPKCISMEKSSESKAGYPYWDVLVCDILIDLKVFKPKTKSIDLSRIKKTLGKLSDKSKTNKVWFVIFAMGYSKEVTWTDLLNSFAIEEVVHTTTTCSDSGCISLCAAQLSM